MPGNPDRAGHNRTRRHVRHIVAEALRQHDTGTRRVTFFREDLGASFPIFTPVDGLKGGRFHDIPIMECRGQQPIFCEKFSFSVRYGLSVKDIVRQRAREAMQMAMSENPGLLFAGNLMTEHRRKPDEKVGAYLNRIKSILLKAGYGRERVREEANG
jgi:hypothetical protein